MTNFEPLPSLYRELYSHVPGKFACECFISCSVSPGVRHVSWKLHDLRFLFDAITECLMCVFVTWIKGFLCLISVLSKNIWLSSVTCVSVSLIDTLSFITCFCLLFNVFKGVYFIVNSTCGYLFIFKVILFLSWVITGSWGRR